MKVDFKVPHDSLRHRYCQNCHSENVHDVIIEDKRLYECGSCKGVYDRLIDIDPRIVWWIDNNTKEYWHESVGVFVRNTNNDLLLIERIIYPYGFTVPAGHLDTGEEPESAARRELEEEAGIVTEKLEHLKDVDIENDPCRKGSDKHRWHVYKYESKDSFTTIPDSGEGKNPVWMSLDEVRKRNLTPPVRYLIEKFGYDLTH